MGVRRDLEAAYDFEIIDEFLDHFSMMVDVMETLIVDLQKEGYYERSVEELFRIFHNIKSASGFLKLEPMTRLATFVEDALAVNWLLEINDMFHTWNDDFKLDNELSKIQFHLLKLPDMEAA